MFEWLEDEMARINTRKFHLVDGPASPKLREVVSTSDAPLPPSYKEFVLRFGNAQLYRRLDYYLVTVYAGPREAGTADGEALILFGRTHTSLAYFKRNLLEQGRESPVFEWRYPQHGVTLYASRFDEWLQQKCAWAKRQFKKKEWREIENGPQPFTLAEQAVVDARRRFTWSVLGLGENGVHRFEVHNGSAMALPFLTIGLRDKRKSKEDRMLDGSAWLPVEAVHPGETKTVEMSCGQPGLPAEYVEPVALPDPGPEDRKQYWEFRAVHPD
ncbi:MAG: hypothetical protein H6841_06645 [Planctomycetes bacterium]|nr:hypothetical protein [Planctomycetota bacterium]